MSARNIRPLAICVFSREGRILAAEGYDSVKSQTFYRPLGGRIEFGEHSRDTIVRELREEIGADAADLSYLGTLENVFTYNGEPGHEIVLVYDGRLADEALYRRESIECRDQDFGDLLFIARWMPLEGFRGAGAPPLYPAGLLELLGSDRAR
jgi:8-oxo-dGTP pyrophosphatase MutT (NUDIX family)